MFPTPRFRVHSFFCNISIILIFFSKLILQFRNLKSITLRASWRIHTLCKVSDETFACVSLPGIILVLTDVTWLITFACLIFNITIRSGLCSLFIWIRQLSLEFWIIKDNTQENALSNSCNFPVKIKQIIFLCKWLIYASCHCRINNLLCRLFLFSLVIHFILISLARSL